MAKECPNWAKMPGYTSKIRQKQRGAQSNKGDERKGSLRSRDEKDEMCLTIWLNNRHTNLFVAQLNETMRSINDIIELMSNLIYQH